MKKIVSYICGAVMVVSMISCTGALESEIEDLKSRVSNLESVCNNLNSNISSLQLILQSVQNKLSITGLEEYDNGYRISFSDGKVFTLYKKTNISAPVIAIAQDDISRGYFWTLNGNWLLINGERVPAVTYQPQLRIDDGYWFVSYDNGKSWTKLGKATGENGSDGTDGDAFFSNVYMDNGYLVITIKGQNPVRIPVSNNDNPKIIRILPTYSDGSVKLGFSKNILNELFFETFTIDFEAYPEESAKYIKKSQLTVTVLVGEAVTRAERTVLNLEIKDLWCHDNNIITLTLDTAPIKTYLESLNKDQSKTVGLSLGLKYQNDYDGTVIVSEYYEIKPCDSTVIIRYGSDSGEEVHGNLQIIMPVVYEKIALEQWRVDQKYDKTLGYSTIQIYKNKGNTNIEVFIGGSFTSGGAMNDSRYIKTFRKLEDERKAATGSNYIGAAFGPNLDFIEFVTQVSVNWINFQKSTVKRLDLSKVNTSGVKYADNMFSGMPYMKTIDLSHFDTSNIVSMTHMFGWGDLDTRPFFGIEWPCSWTDLDLSTFDTSNVVSMDGMFQNCEYLANVNLSGFNTEKVVDMNHMFSDCKKLKSIDISSFRSTSVLYLSGMFQNCETLTELDLSNFSNFSHIFNAAQWERDLYPEGMLSNLIEGCSRLRRLNLSNWSYSKNGDSIPDFGGRFYNEDYFGSRPESLTEIYLGNADTVVMTELICRSFFKNKLINRTYPNMETCQDVWQYEFNHGINPLYIFKNKSSW